jgi:hypothetical protein
MLVIAPKDNLVTTFRVAVVIEPSRGGAVVESVSFRRFVGRMENIALGRTDQAD